MAQTPTDSDADDEEIGVREARDTVVDLAEDLFGHPLDGIAAVERVEEGGWRVTAEVVERKSVPDTQDILGRYVVSLDPAGRVEGYGRNGRYRRDDTSGEDGPTE